MTKIETQNFNLTKERFNELLLQLRDGEEQLFEHVFLQHFTDCRAYLIREDGVPEDLAYDATMDAFLAFREYLGRGTITYGNLRYLLTRMARQHLYKRMGRERSVPLDGAALPSLSDDPELESPQLDALRAGWKLLGDKCKSLLRRIYYCQQSMVEIARAEGRKEAAVRKQKGRCVGKLRGGMVNRG